ncbi:hypothetical protein NEOLEDRAFT_1133778 [Neolentinus lepideus HHB14362 ss-1]|uniref:Chromatin modification-related protein EAF7 n=1 Tax=Neolentinus lepideus HHB14362 ss-1 TaxID=1314782 RepID=A0A165SMW3_9AGAM|nr:hypothetical protein NEOLEDRAFT_1133778 [Neolentinus lepideus HHB14362 ss-1]
MAAYEHYKEQHILDTVDGEISFFRSLMRARPVGIHRHFHALSMRTAIYKDTGHLVSMEEIWEKLRDCYDLDALEGLETDGYDSPGSTPSIINPPSPSPSENLSGHPHFRQEYSLPSDPSFENLIATRRMRSSVSVPSSPPAPSPPVTVRVKRGAAKTRGKKGGKGRKRRNTAGLVAGESDSSALTQESGDESVIPTPRESVVTGTDVGSDAEMAEDEEDEERDASAEPASKSTRKTTTKKRGSGRTRTASTSRPMKKKKR